MKQLVGLLLTLILARTVSAEVVSIDAALNKHAIDPRIYGVNNASQAQLDDLNATINRSGGTPTSRYNWQQNAINTGDDYFFESVPSDVSGDSFIQNSKAAKAEPMLTVPLLDWVAKLGPGGNTLGSFAVSKYGPQDASDGDFGNGVKKDGKTFVTGNDPNDANVPSSVMFQDGWLKHIIQQFGNSDAAGLRYYLLDQEPGIWHASHRDVHPAGAKMQEVRDKMIAYATMIKSNDTKALVGGPDEWNFEGYLLSGFDEQTQSQSGNFDLHPDRDANGGTDYLPYILDQLHKYEMAGHPRLLDIFSVHYYPQDRFNSDAGIFSDNVSSAVQLARNVSTRSLWDPNYTDDSYLGDNGFKINLIPRLKGWVGTYYPNTLIALNEYSWGAEGHISGATAQADVLGIFGREGLDMACRWEAPAAGSPVANAFKMYRNYDGNKSVFGDISVFASVTNPDQLAAFAAVRSADGALTVMVVNKSVSDTPLQLTLANFNMLGTAQVWQLTSANTIARLADMSAAGGNLNTTVPAQSITLFVIAETSNHAPTVTSAASATPNPAKPGEFVNFLVSASDADGDALTYQWDFGDGSQGTGANVLYTYATAGTFNAKVVVSDTHGATAVSVVTVVVSDDGGTALIFVGTDSDKDGIPDAVELSASTNPNNASSTPDMAALTVSTFKASVSPATASKNTLSVTGTLSDLPQGFTAGGKMLTVFVGNLQLAFPLNARGSGKNDHGTVMLRLKGKRDKQTGQIVFQGGVAPLKAKLKGVDLPSSLGISAATPAQNLTVQILAVLPNTVFLSDVDVSYLPGGSKPGKLVK